MSESYRVIFSADAIDDLIGIQDYIATHSPSNAIAVTDHLLAELNSLSVFPSRYAIQRGRRNLGFEIRRMPIDPFRAYYRVREEHHVVEILRVHHGSRKPWP